MLGLSTLGDSAFGDTIFARPVTLTGGATVETSAQAATLHPVTLTAGATVETSAQALALLSAQLIGGAGAVTSLTATRLTSAAIVAGASAEASLTQGAETPQIIGGAGAVTSLTAAVLHPASLSGGGTCESQLTAHSLTPSQLTAGASCTTTATASRLGVARLSGGTTVEASAIASRLILSSIVGGAGAVTSLTAGVQDDSKAMISIGQVLLEWDVFAVYLSWFAPEDIMVPLHITTGSTDQHPLTLNQVSRKDGLKPLPLDGCGAFSGIIQQMDQDTGLAAGQALPVTVSKATEAGQVLLDFADTALTPGLWTLQVSFVDGAGRTHIYRDALVRVVASLSL